MVLYILQNFFSEQINQVLPNVLTYFSGKITPTFDRKMQNISRIKFLTRSSNIVRNSSANITVREKFLAVFSSPAVQGFQSCC